MTTTATVYSFATGARVDAAQLTAPLTIADLYAAAQGDTAVARASIRDAVLGAEDPTSMLLALVDLALDGLEFAEIKKLRL